MCIELLLLVTMGMLYNSIPMPFMKVSRIWLCRFCNDDHHDPPPFAGGQDSASRALDTMEFLQEPSKQDLVYWSVLNPPETGTGHRGPYNPKSGFKISKEKKKRRLSFGVSAIVNIF